MTKVTLRIKRDLLQKARLLAAEKGISIGALVNGYLEQIVRERRGYQYAQKRALARLSRGFDLKFRPAARRDELHDR